MCCSGWGGLIQSTLIQEKYSKVIENIAKETGCLLVDIRSAFLKQKKFEIFCVKMVFIRTQSQQVISEVFMVCGNISDMISGLS
jgi:hypothetical protein